MISEDWTGGDEERYPEAYQRHLQIGRPLCLPTKWLRGIVTGRMHLYRAQTVAWLKKHRVPYKDLWMLPASTERERERIGPARFKARVYAESQAYLEGKGVRGRKRCQEPNPLVPNWPPSAAASFVVTLMEMKAGRTVRSNRSIWNGQSVHGAGRERMVPDTFSSPQARLKLLT